MTHRWYDHDPLLSMAISLLQNASPSHQETVSQYMYKIMDAENLLDSESVRTSKDHLRFIFPLFRRQKFKTRAWQLVELLKHLPFEQQQNVASQMIHYIYLLEGHLSELPLLEFESLESEEAFNS